MKNKFVLLVLVMIIMVSPAALAQREVREVPAFTELSLRITAKVHLIQGEQQKVEIDARSSVKDEMITEVTGRTLVIRFPARYMINRSFDPGNIDIYITVPEINALTISGSGDILAEGSWTSRIIDLNVSGSGSIYIDNLNSERVKAVVSGSGDVVIKDGKMAEEFSGTISGSGNIKAGSYEARYVTVKIAGSGNVNIHTNGTLNARIAGSGNVYYSGNPNLDTSVAGSGKVIHQN
jgi:hypothetical protein